LSILAIALAMVLILVIDGFAAGMFEQVTTYYYNIGTDVMVVQSGVEGVLTSMSSLPGSLRDELGDIKDVDEVHEIISIPTIFLRGGEKTPINLIGYHPGEIGGPWRLAEGRGVRNGDEVVLDLALAGQNEIKVGDSVSIMGRDFKVSGLSLETASWMSPLVFVGEEAAADMLQAGDIVSVFLVTVKPRTSVNNIEKEIEDRLPQADVFTTDQMARKERSVFEGLLGNVFTLITTVAFGVGILVVGLTVYTSIIERISDYGILKSIGASNASLYVTVLIQSAIITVLGFAVGAFLSVYVGRAIEALLPQFTVVIGVSTMIRGAVAAVIMAAVAAYTPVRRIASIDPSLVFRG
ncbi:MAG: ABC transporter permease, partial [Candidatus Aquicultor sp.]|nr:ABC transporter permease [Candidatus Aquicultor sp.]